MTRLDTVPWPAQELVLPKEKAVTLELIAEGLGILPLSEELIPLVQLCKNKLLHRVRKPLHPWKEVSVSKVKVI